MVSNRWNKRKDFAYSAGTISLKSIVDQKLRFLPSETPEKVGPDWVVFGRTSGKASSVAYVDRIFCPRELETIKVIHLLHSTRQTQVKLSKLNSP